MSKPLSTESDPLAVDFVARLGSAMIAANYPIGLVRRTVTMAAERYGLVKELLVLPNFIQFSGLQRAEGTMVRAVRSERELRFDQTFPLATLVRRAERGDVTANEGLAELDRIDRQRPRFPAWVTVIGYAAISAAFALILQPNLLALVAATGFGLLVGVLNLLGRVSTALTQLLPTIAAFAVAFTAFSVGRLLHLGEDSLRALAPALVLFLPGTAITLAVIELTSREVVSGSARLVAGGMRLVQLAFGILIAAQAVGLTASELSVASVDKFGPWAPWLGVAVYAVGVLLYHGPPPRFMPWMLVILFVAYAGQVGANAVFGSYSSGFGGALAMTLCAMVIAQRPKTPPAFALLLPGFWLLVPGSMGLIGVTELVGADSVGAIGVTLISMISIAIGIEAGLLLWGAYRQLRRNVE